MSPEPSSQARQTEAPPATLPDANSPEALLAEFRSALASLTVLGRTPPDAARTSPGRTALFYPAVGLLIGLVLVLLDAVLGGVLSQELMSVVLVAALAIVSGGRQLEGFANTADGLIGFRGREWAMATMRDRRLGTSGAAAIFFLLYLKIRSLDLISDPDRLAAVALAPMIGRFAMALLAHGARDAAVPAGERRFDPELTARELGIAAAATFLVVLVLAQAVGLLAMVAAVLLTLGLRVYFDRRLGGISHQSLDAVAEAAETVALLIFALGS